MAPLYLSEISPVALRGLCGTFNQLAITFGVLIAEVIGLSIALGTESLWPLTLGELHSTLDCLHYFVIGFSGSGVFFVCHCLFFLLCFFLGYKSVTENVF